MYKSTVTPSSIKMGTFTNSVDEAEMPQNAKTKSIFRGRNILFSRMYSLCPLKYTLDHPDLAVSNFMENSIAVQRVKRLQCRAQWLSW